MRSKNSTALICLTIGLLMPLESQAQEQGRVPIEAGYEIVNWNRAPMKITLGTDTERYIWFPEKVQPGLPPELAQKLRVQAQGDTIYLLAREPFAFTRLPVRGLESGDIFIIDLQATESGPAEPVRVVLPGDDSQTGAATAAAAPGQKKSPANHGYKTLARYASQNVYSPPRLVNALDGIYKVPIAKGGTTSALVRGDVIEATPLASWRAENGLYVTAVMVVNKLQSDLPLDPRLLRGSWLAAAAQHGTLGPRGTAADTSTYYLISDRRFEEAISPWLD